jgi:hypothetical protein
MLRALEAAHVPHGSGVYVATNERNVQELVAPLRKFYVVTTLDSLPKELSHASSLMPATLALIDYSVVRQCSNYIPTFSSEEGRGLGLNISLSVSGLQNDKLDKLGQ